MRVLNESGFVPGWCVGRVAPHAVSATLIVKGTFRLRPDAAAEADPEQEPLSGDVHEEEDPERPLRYPSDFAWYKPRADLLLVGTCHQPKGRHGPICAVAFGVGAWLKRLAVVGDRRIVPRFFFFRVPGEPDPFRSLKLSYERSFGGGKYPMNPNGRGHGESVLPNIYAWDRVYVDPDSRPEPAGFGPLAPALPQRSRKTGTYNKTWQKRDWPGWPQDFDWTYYNAAPPDQQIPAYLRGDEALLFENLHPSRSAYRSSLPGVRPRWFLNESLPEGPRFREIPLHLDTLWVDMDRERLVLVWRGVADLRHKKMKEIEDHFLLAEPVAEPARPLDHYRRRLEEAKAEPARPPRPWRQPAPAAPPAPAFPQPAWKKEFDEAMDGHTAEFRKLEQLGRDEEAKVRSYLRSQGKDYDRMVRDAPTYEQARSRMIELQAARRRSHPQAPDLNALLPASLPNPPADLFSPPPAAAPPAPPPPPRPSRETVEAAAKARRGCAGLDLTGLDLSRLDLSGVSFEGAVLRGADLRGARLSKSNLNRANLSGANLGGADLSDVRAEKTDFAGARLADADLSRASLADADFSRADLSGANLTSARAKGVLLMNASLARACLRGADLTSATLFEADLAGADATSATFAQAQAYKARGAGIVFEKADLAGFSATGGADFSRGRFAGARGPQTVWQAALLDGADFTGAVLPQANFTAASLRGSVFSGADLRKARFVEARLETAKMQRVNLLQGSFEEADLRGCDLLGSNLFQVEFWNARTDGANFEGADLTGTKLAGQA